MQEKQYMIDRRHQPLSLPVYPSLNHNHNHNYNRVFAGFAATKKNEDYGVFTGFATTETKRR